MMEVQEEERSVTKSTAKLRNECLYSLDEMNQQKIKMKADVV